MTRSAKDDDATLLALIEENGEPKECPVKLQEKTDVRSATDTSIAWHASGLSDQADGSLPCGDSNLQGAKKQQLIDVFCTFNSWVVRIEYPRPGRWRYCTEAGGYFHHMWDFESGVMRLVSRRNTCRSSVLPRQYCRNCLMRSVWRLECVEPCHSFYMYAAAHAVCDCIAALRPLVHQQYTLPDDASRLYMIRAPNPASMQRKARDYARKLRSLSQLEASVQQSASNVPTTSSELSAFLSELGDELDRKDALDCVDASFDGESPGSKAASLSNATTSGLAAPLLQGESAPEDTPSSSASYDTGSACSVYTPTRPNHAPQLIGRTVTLACEALLELLSHIDQELSVSVTHRELAAIDAAHIPTTNPLSLLGASSTLDALARRMGAPRTCQLFLKRSLVLWLQTILSFSKRTGSVTVGLAFYAAPTEFIYTDIYQSSITPSFITDASHRLERDYGTAAAQARSNGTRPIVVAFYHDSFPMIPGAVMLPLGIVYQ